MQIDIIVNLTGTVLQHSIADVLLGHYHAALSEHVIGKDQRAWYMICNIMQDEKFWKSHYKQENCKSLGCLYSVKVKEKLSLCFIKYHVMKTYRGTCS
jgi:hypothetical protein